MRTGISYMGHHNPQHIETDMREMRGLKIDDVLVACQENDFVYFNGKLKFTPKIAKDHGLRPIAIFWGALNLFGGGRSSMFLLEHPEGFQVGLGGEHLPQGCYVNPVCVDRIKQMIDIASGFGFQGYFVDEPTRLKKCFCQSCRARYREWYNADLAQATGEQQDAFRQRCVIEYVRTIADYCKANHPHLETQTCLMPHDSAMWAETARIRSLDNLGTDIYWVNNDKDVAEMVPIMNQMASLCKENKKIHHEWLQCWNVRKGREKRILEQGNMFLKHPADVLYIWAWKGQVGTSETCDDPETSWQYACDILKKAKAG